MDRATSPDLQETLTRIRANLLAQRNSSGHWEGELSSSALSTATAVFALELASRTPQKVSQDDRRTRNHCARGIDNRDRQGSGVLRRRGNRQEAERRSQCAAENPGIEAFHVH